MNTSDPNEEKKIPELTAQTFPVQAGENHGARETPAKKQRPGIDSLGALFTDLFGSERPRLALKQSELAAIDRGPGLGTDRSRHLDLAAGDYTLERTRQLMLFTLSFSTVGKTREVAEFLCDVLKIHPAFQAAPVVEYLNDLRESSQPDALRKLFSQDYSSLPPRAENPSLTKLHREKCRANALQCLLLLPWLNGQGSLIQLVESLRTNLWRSYEIGRENDKAIVSALLQSRETTGAIVYDLTRTANEAASVQLESIRADQRKTLRQAQDAKAALSKAKTVIDDLEGQVADLRRDLQKSKENLTNSEALSADRYASLRGRVLGKYRSESSLLSEGLLALRRDPPKVHVMIDHAERVIESLKDEILRLEEKETHL